MVLPVLLAAATIACYHCFWYMGSRGSAWDATDTPDVELQVLDEFLAGGNVSGFALMSPQSKFADRAVFQEHLLSLLRANSNSLDQLSDSHLAVEVHDAYPLPMWSKKYMWAPAHSGAPASFVSKSITIDFDIGFNHSQRISRRAVQESLATIVAAGAGAWREGGVDARRAAGHTCNTGAFEAACTKMCEDGQYLFKVCANCGCEGYEGTASCSCFIQTGQFSLALAANSIYAVLMCLCGVLFCRGNAYSKLYFVRGGDIKIPDIGHGDFKDGIFACQDDMKTCCTTCCCPIIQAALTNQKSGVGDYCRSLLFLGFIYAIPGCLGLGLLFPIVICCYRRAMRQEAKMGKDSCMDLVCSCCCVLCVICQEARHFDEAANIAFPEEPEWKKDKELPALMKKKNDTDKDKQQAEVVGAPAQ